MIVQLKSQPGKAEKCIVQAKFNSVNLLNLLLFRFTVQASLKTDLYRYPCFALKNNGDIFVGRCSCESKTDGKCVHVACGFYFIEDLSYGVEPKTMPIPTSARKMWGVGTNVSKNPQPLHLAKYSKKKDVSKLIKFGPRIPCLRKTTEKEVNDFILELQTTCPKSMWLDVLKIKYDDYQVDQPRQKILLELVTQFIQNLARQVERYEEDLLSNHSVIHITGTEEQASSDLWHNMRQYRVTASIFKDFANRPIPMTNKLLWKPKADISNVQAVCWGVQHESEAIKELEEIFGTTITRPGLFVSKERSYIAASPDGLVNKRVLEIKCPFVLRDSLPNELDKLLPSQRSAHFNKLNQDGGLTLKQSHKYCWQVQASMYVGGCKQSYFTT